MNLKYKQCWRLNSTFFLFFCSFFFFFDCRRVLSLLYLDKGCGDCSLDRSGSVRTGQDPCGSLMVLIIAVCSIYTESRFSKTVWGELGLIDSHCRISDLHSWKLCWLNVPCFVIAVTMETCVACEAVFVGASYNCSVLVVSDISDMVESCDNIQTPSCFLR